MEKLKPCPFCGSANVEAMNYANFLLGIWWVECRECFSRTRFCTTEVGAIEAWNRRVNDEV